jgi:tRNA nucleotidyltransferase (CCA-adding enzyme)
VVKINIPLGAEIILKILRENGYEAYVVGGCVRDSLLGRQPKDWDITTNCLPEETITLFQSTHNVIPTGLKHGTVTLIGTDHIPFEVTTYRIDGKYLDNRHPDRVEFTNSLKEDLSRRDFTINALAYNEQEGLIDYFGGIADLNSKIIRCVGNAADRFDEDALRMLRAIRFQAQLEFKIDKDIYNALLKLSYNIKNISIERIREEFNKILIANPMDIHYLSYLNLLKHFIPEYDMCECTTQINPYHIYDVGKHLLHSAENIDKNLQLKLTMFLHDIAKPQCKSTDESGIDHFYGHAEQSFKLAETILKRMKYDNKTIEKVITLVKYHDLDINHKKQIKRLLNEIGEDNLRDLLKVKEADIKAQNLDFYEKRHDNLKRVEDEIDDIIGQQQCFTIKNLKVNGRDLIQLGISQGKEIGVILEQLLDIVLDNPKLNEKEKLIEIVINRLNL